MSEDDRSKLKILLTHWIEHNQEHAEEFAKWALRARANGNAEVHAHIMEAVRQMNRVNESLLAALEKL